MTEQEIHKMHDVVIYNVNRMYFDHFVPAHLDAAYAQFEQTKDQRDPITHARVVVGQIDGVTICRALWTEMSYNPLRFGVTSPFTINGVESVSDFCNVNIQKGMPAFETLKKVQYHMTEFLRLNYGSDKVRTRDGTVLVSRIDGHSDENYQVLSHLRKMIHAVATQNLKDLQIKKYRTEMAKVIKARHPNGIRGNKPVYVKEKTSEEISLEVAQLMGIAQNKPNVAPKAEVIEKAVFAYSEPADVYDNAFEESENERIQIEVDKIWHAKDKIVSVEEYKRKELENNLTPLPEQYQKECDKIKSKAKKSKGLIK